MSLLCQHLLSISIQRQNACRDLTEAEVLIPKWRRTASLLSSLVSTPGWDGSFVEIDDIFKKQCQENWVVGKIPAVGVEPKAITYLIGPMEHFHLLDGTCPIGQNAGAQPHQGSHGACLVQRRQPAVLPTAALTLTGRLKYSITYIFCLKNEISPYKSCIIASEKICWLSGNLRFKVSLRSG